MHTPVRTDFEPHSAALLKARYFSVDIPSFDGTRIRATVYQPALAPKDTAPVIIHAHAFGFFRMSQPKSLYGRYLYTGKTAIEAWRQGYWVISYDQRGHGASGGKIGLMDPEFEVRDLSYIIDWIENNIPRLSY
ncbi:MAG: CocE/NonD family hydrolase, partial [Pseudomonadota bacterium]